MFVFIFVFVLSVYHLNYAFYIIGILRLDSEDTERQTVCAGNMGVICFFQVCYIIQIGSSLNTSVRIIFLEAFLKKGYFLTTSLESCL